jgi:hypothetical protein
MRLKTLLGITLTPHPECQCKHPSYHHLLARTADLQEPYPREPDQNLLWTTLANQREQTKPEREHHYSPHWLGSADCFFELRGFPPLLPHPRQRYEQHTHWSQLWPDCTHWDQHHQVTTQGQFAKRSAHQAVPCLHPLGGDAQEFSIYFPK